MPLMQEAMSKADWEMMEAGKRPPKRQVVPRPEPEMPKVEKLLKFDAVPKDRFVRLVSAVRMSIKNNEGITFVGFNVEMEIKYAESTKKTKNKTLDTIMAEEKETYILSGWMPEGEWMQFLRAMRTRIDLGVLQM